MNLKVVEDMVAFYCNPGKIGDMFGSMATNDITFWPVYSAQEIHLIDFYDLLNRSTRHWNGCGHGSASTRTISMKPGLTSLRIPTAKATTPTTSAISKILGSKVVQWHNVPLNRLLQATTQTKNFTIF